MDWKGAPTWERRGVHQWEGWRWTHEARHSSHLETAAADNAAEVAAADSAVVESSAEGQRCPVNGGEHIGASVVALVSLVLQAAQEY